MGWVRGEEGPLLLAEPLFTSRDERERLCQLAFEVFNVPAYHAADQAVLALYCVGRLSGLVVDIGLGKIGAWVHGAAGASMASECSACPRCGAGWLRE